MESDNTRGFWNRVGMGGAILFVLFASVLVAPSLKSSLGGAATVSSASLVASSIFSGILVFVYASIAQSERKQSEEIQNQVEVMRNQASAAHQPLIAVEQWIVTGEGAKIELRNLGNGPATGIDFKAEIEMAGHHDLSIEVNEAYKQWASLDKQYLEPGEDDVFPFSLDVTVHKDGGEIFTGNVTEATVVLEDEGVNVIHWRTNIVYDTLIDDSVEKPLSHFRIEVSELKGASEHYQ